MDQRSVLYLRLVTGLVVGVVAGALAALLAAPQSGRQTREQLRLRSETLLQKANISLARTSQKFEGLFSMPDRSAQSLIIAQTGARIDDTEILAE
jgi:gas vesicle protein